MGSSKSVTSSYWYSLILHLGLGKGPFDSLLEVRGGDRVAWQGRMESSGIFNIHQPNLYGGEGAEGGIDGDFELMMGESDQAVNPYITENFGPGSAYRGRASILLRGAKIGAGNPYPKPLYFKCDRILKGWDDLNYDEYDSELWNEAFARIEIPGSSPITYGMNGAHILYDSIVSRRENGGMEEPTSLIDEASFQTASATLYSESFALCCTWFGGESAEQFQQRILNVIGGCLSQSRVDGRYHLDLLRDTVPDDQVIILTDDDILDWTDEPVIPSEAINQLQVQWFDPMTREERITTPIQALGAIQDAGGVIADIKAYYEACYEELALRVCQRDVDSFSTALTKFTITCTRYPWDVRPGMKILLQCPKRGFADVLAVVGDVDFGDFQSDEMNLVLLEDIFSLPETSVVDPQGGLGNNANDPPNVIDSEVIMEVPYLELAASLPQVNLDALPADAAFVLVGADRPDNGNNYVLETRPEGGEYEPHGTFDWCPTATISNSDPLSNAAPREDLTFSEGKFLDRVKLGTWALWGTEMCRVDALDLTAHTLSLGRGCGDTPPEKHASNQPIYFLSDWYGYDGVQYVEGETVNAKLLNRTSSQQIELDDANEMSIELVGRQILPYPPGKVKFNDLYYPSFINDGEIVLTWQHRDRLTQKDQLIDFTAASVGPETGVTYTVRWILNGTLDHTDSAVAGTTVSYTPSGDGILRVEIEAHRGAYVSNVFSHQLSYGGEVLQLLSGDFLKTLDDQLIDLLG